MRIDRTLKKMFVGKTLVDTEFSSKGDYRYYETIGVDYPGFDGIILDVELTTDADKDVVIRFKTSTGFVDIYDNEGIELN